MGDCRPAGEPCCNDLFVEQLKADCNASGPAFTVPCDILVGADGANGNVGKQASFEYKTFKGGQAIGITCNFFNGGSASEKTIPEFTCSKVYNQGFFKMLQEKYQLETE